MSLRECKPGDHLCVLEKDKTHQWAKVRYVTQMCIVADVHGYPVWFFKGSGKEWGGERRAVKA